MRILRIILMVCFVFTAYTPIGEAVDIEAVDISKGSKKKSSSRAALPLGVEDVGVFENKENQGDFYMLELEAVETKADGIPDSESEPPHLNERILQLQKKSLATPTEDDGY